MLPFPKFYKHKVGKRLLAFARAFIRADFFINHNLIACFTSWWMNFQKSLLSAHFINRHYGVVMRPPVSHPEVTGSIPSEGIISVRFDGRARLGT